jgi:nicotinamide mononucleotide transporter
VTTCCIVFFRSKLYADAGLQIFYFAFGIAGWYLWLCGDEQRSELKVVRATRRELTVLSALTVLAIAGLWQILRHVGGSAPFWDALTTSISLASQWLLNRKRLENWVGWIVVDVIYVPLYVYRDLYLTAILYALFLVMAIVGLQTWRQSWLAQSQDLPTQPHQPEA